jgi:hypothetical protein
VNQVSSWRRDLVIRLEALLGKPCCLLFVLFFFFPLNSFAADSSRPVPVIQPKHGLNYKSSKEKTQGKLQNNNPIGHWIYWYDNGQKKMEGDYESFYFSDDYIDSTRVVGSWRFWTRHGKELHFPVVFPINQKDIESVNLQQDALWITTMDTSYHRKEYVQISPESKLILFYEHGRAISPVLSHTQQYILVDDSPATHSSEIYIVDLKNGKKWRIDNPARNYYFQEVPLKGIEVLPEFNSFSPSDEQVLIHMFLGYTFPSAKNPHPEKNYQDWSYVVDSKSGKILKEYRTMKIPTHWWVGHS